MAWCSLYLEVCRCALGVHVWLTALLWALFGGVYGCFFGIHDWISGDDGEEHELPVSWEESFGAC